MLVSEAVYVGCGPLTYLSSNGDEVEDNAESWLIKPSEQDSKLEQTVPELGKLHKLLPA